MTGDFLSGVKDGLAKYLRNMTNAVEPIEQQKPRGSLIEIQFPIQSRLIFISFSKDRN